MEHAMTGILEKLGPRIRDEIREAIEASMASGEHRVPRHRFNKRATATERNAFTHELIEHLSWLDSREGRSQSTSSGSQPISILASVIEMTLLHAHEKGFSPLQVLELGTRRAQSILSSPPELCMVTDLVKVILDEAGQQLEDGMTFVAYAKASDRKMKAAEQFLKGVEGEYRKNGIHHGENEAHWIHFERPEDAEGFKKALIESGVEVFEAYELPNRGEEATEQAFSPLKLSIMRAIWAHSPYGSADFGEVLEAVSDAGSRLAIARIGIQADAVLDALATPNEDMIRGGCLEADPIGSLIGYDPDQCTTQEDIAAVYEAMIREGRERNRLDRPLKKASPAT
jgi:hypothetical protein